MTKKFYITTPIYYVNDKPHLGHAYTTIAADILARYHRFIGDEVFFLTGTDEHGAKVAKSAEKVGKTPKQFCDEISALYTSLWDALNISNNDFIRTTDERHEIGAKKFIEKLKEADAIYEGSYEGLYCTGCEKFLTEKELVDGKCPDHKICPDKISEKNYFFKLDKYAKKVQELIETDKIKIEPENIKTEVLGLFKQELENFSVSREKVTWGIKVPWDESQVIYVWVDALSNYITALGYGNVDDSKFRKYWPANLQLMGKDIIKFHAIYWPAMLLALNLSVPKQIFANGYFTVNGQKMSKTIGNTIDPNDLVKKYGSDATRFLIISQFPFGQDGDVKAEKFDEQFNANLANGLGNLVSRVTAMYLKLDLKKNKNNVLANKEAVRLVANAWKNYEKFMEENKVDQSLKSTFSLVKFANEYISVEKPWELIGSDDEKATMVLLNLIEIIRHVAWMIYPFLPETVEKILTQFSMWEEESKLEYAKLKKWKRFDLDLQVKKGQALFPRI
ncbi:MAG: methionine--tRNA ligase [Patescibacteria group bacterium]|jgi:methionyl-tRNA synthetase